MAQTNHVDRQDGERNQEEIIALGLPSIFKKYEKEFCERFRILKPWESPIPLEEFLKTYANNTQAMLCSGAVNKLDANILRHLPALRLVITTSAGVNHIDFEECMRRGISVANASTIFSADVADMAVGLLIDVLRKISAANRFVKSGLLSVKGHYPLGTKVISSTLYRLCIYSFSSSFPDKNQGQGWGIESDTLFTNSTEMTGDSYACS